MKVRYLRQLVCISLIFGSCGIPSQETALHKTFKLGSSMSEILTEIKQASDSIKQIDYTGEMAAPFTTQTQINSYGIEVLGKKRHVEFLFNDGPLGHIWILINKEEIEPIAKELQSLSGDIVFDKNGIQVFGAGSVALQSNPPEVLIATPEMIQALTGYTATK